MPPSRGRPSLRGCPSPSTSGCTPTEFGDREAEVKALLAQYPEDIRIIGLRMPAIYAGAPGDPSYRWVNFDAPPGSGHAALDSRAPITDWAQLDGILDDFPSPDCPGLIPYVGGDDGRYPIGKWWFCLFERHWMLRVYCDAPLLGEGKRGMLIPSPGPSSTRS